MKRLAILVLLLAIFSLILLAGCIETKATFTFHDDGTYDSKVVFKTDKIMGGDELTFLGWQIAVSYTHLKNLNGVLLVIEKWIDKSNQKT